MFKYLINSLVTINIDIKYGIIAHNKYIKNLSLGLKIFKSSSISFGSSKNFIVLFLFIFLFKKNFHNTSFNDFKCTAIKFINVSKNKILHDVIVITTNEKLHYFGEKRIIFGVKGP